MLEQLSLVLVAAVVLVVPATALIFTVDQRQEARRIRRGARIVAYRLIILAIGVGLVTVGIARLLGAELATAMLAGIVLAASVLAWLPLARVWAGRGVAAWALTIDAGVVYLTYVLVWTFTTGLSWPELVASLLLWLLEAFVFLIGLGYLWEFVDVLARRVWPSYVEPRRLGDRGYRPYVSLHVPTHNEPPELVIATLERLLEQDYDYYEIVVVDNNTTDPALWRPVEAFCAQHWRIKFLHIEDWPGFKSGALNYALEHTDLRAEVIGIIDADYLVRPDFLADCAPMFADPGISFVQTPQDYRGWEDAPYFRRLYHSYGYFFDVSQRSRNDRNGAIFGGTMGLIRRSALNAVGGWDEWCITEDVELSLRLLRAGGSGAHVDRSYGHGVMPLTFEALKQQRFRWCFGGVQLLRMHWRSLLPRGRTADNRLTLGQRWAYLAGGLQWFGDLVSVLFTGCLLLGALDAIAGNGLLAERLSGFLLLSVAVLIVLGAVRAVALVRRTSSASWGEAAGALGLWLGLGWSVARAAGRGLFARQGVFLRTPKVRGELDALDALRGNLAETLLTLACTTVGLLALAEGELGATAVGTLLLIQAAGYAAAPLNSLAAIRSYLPEELRRRRRLALSSWGTPARHGGMAIGAAAAAVVGLLVVAAPLTAPELGELGRGADGPESTTETSRSTGPSPEGDSTDGPADGSNPTLGSAPRASPPSRTTRTTPQDTTPGGRPTATPSTTPPDDEPTGRPTGRPTSDPPGKPTALPTNRPTDPGKPTG